MAYISKFKGSEIDQILTDVRNSIKPDLSKSIIDINKIGKELSELSAEVEEINEKINNLPQDASMTAITYADLVSLRDNGGLVAGAFYRVFDSPAGYSEGIVVHALTNDQLSEDAEAILVKGANVESFKIQHWEGEIIPAYHPDLSTQASVLPYRFMGNLVYEELIPCHDLFLEWYPHYEKPLILSCDLIGECYKMSCNATYEPEINELLLSPIQAEDIYRQINFEDMLFVRITYTKLEELSDGYYSY